MSRVIRFDKLRSLVLIGGGDLMLHAARAYRARGIDCSVVFAPRHADELLPIDGRVARAVFLAEGFPVHVVEDMAADESWRSAVRDPGNALALCCGPAWVFPEGVRTFFGLGMINFNGIPVPRYVGGAHYTWQILNGDRSGGCIIQEITPRLDRGDVLRAEYFSLPDNVRVPLDYFKANYDLGLGFFDRLAADMASGAPFEAKPFAEFDEGRIYLPRLLTAENAFIDWSWEAPMVARFCDAFDEPYMGASTYLGEKLLRLRNVSLAASEDFHPFTAGLVVRKREDAVYVAARGGLLRIGEVRDAYGADALSGVREGMRLHTSAERLAHARTFKPQIGAKAPKSQGA